MMIAIKVFWIIANTITAVWFSYIALMNPILQVAMRKIGGSVADRTIIILLSVLIIFHCVIAIAVYQIISFDIAVVVTSLAVFGWILVSYFLLQRFADALERTMMVHNNPMFLPLAAFAGFIVSTLAIIFLADWRWAFLPIVLYLLLGFLCTEIAIRRCMRRGCNRELAIFMINEAQGRCHNFIDFLYKSVRYPFP
jgi:hypothetical protein